MKTRPLILFLLIVALLAQAGCTVIPPSSTSKPDTSSVDSDLLQNTSDDSMETELVLKKWEYYPFEGGTRLRSIARIDSTLLLHGTKNGKTFLKTVTYSTDDSGELAFFAGTDFVFPVTDSEDESFIWGICSANDCFYILSSELPPEYTLGGELHKNYNYAGRAAVIVYSKNGDVIAKHPFLWSGNQLFGIAVDSADQALVWGDAGYSFLSLKEETILTSSPMDNDWVLSAANTEKGIILSAASGYYLFDATGARKKLEISNPYDVVAVEAGNESIYQGLHGEYVVNMNSRFFECDFDSGTCKELFQWDYSSYAALGCPYVCRLGKNSFVCTIRGQEYLLVAGLVTQEKTERQNVRVALVASEETNAIGTFSELNAANGQYHYEVIEYSSADIDRFNASLLSSECPDLVVFGSRSGVYTASEVYLDLYPFIESDHRIGMDFFLPNLLDTLSVNGTLREIWPGVTITSIASRSCDADEIRQTKASDLAHLAKQKGYLDVFQSYMSAQNLLKCISSMAAAKFVDKGTGLCSFDSPEFIELLKWCQDMGPEIPEGSSYSGPAFDEVMLSFEMLSDLSRLPALSKLHGMPCSFVGFPGSKDGFSIYSNGVGYAFAIPSGSSNIGGAWEYIASQLSIELQMKLSDCFPVVREAMYQKAEAVLDTKEIQELEGLLSHTTCAENYYIEPIRTIIMENGAAFLAGDKSAEETANLIQKRASLWLAEQG